MTPTWILENIKTLSLDSVPDRINMSSYLNLYADQNGATFQCQFTTWTSKTAMIIKDDLMIRMTIDADRSKKGMGGTDIFPIELEINPATERDFSEAVFTVIPTRRDRRSATVEALGFEEAYQYVTWLLCLIKDGKAFDIFVPKATSIYDPI